MPGSREHKYKLITCILPKGIAVHVVKRLKSEQGILSANINNARGVGKLTPLAYRGVGAQSEKEILSVVVPEKLAEEIFAFIFEEAKINRPHGGIMYMGALSRSTAFILPELPDEA